MVLKYLVLQYKDTSYNIEFETELGIEVLKHQIFSLTSVLPEDQEILGLSFTDELVSDARNLSNLHISSKRHITMVENKKHLALHATSVNKQESTERMDEELAFQLQAKEDALYMKQEETSKIFFEARLDSFCKQILLYEDSARQDVARSSIPFNELEEKAAVALAKEGKMNPTKDEFDHFFLLQLLFWFKQHFRWIDSLPCSSCEFLETDKINSGVPTLEELQFGANRVELFSCRICGTISRFPRYNDPLKLVETRSGRCGEWANCFTFYCRVVGYQARLVVDFTDHVWTECFSEFLGCWMHLDPCESSFDKPLLYEQGWGKQLSYIFAFSKDGVYDVTRRYTRKWSQVLSRRNMVSETAVQEVLTSLTARLRRNCPVTELIELQRLVSKELQELDQRPREAFGALQGRQSGSEEWRLGRGETGMIVNQVPPSPKRLCIDEHVSQIYEAMARMCCDEEAAYLLKPLKDWLGSLCSRPYKSRCIRVSCRDEQEAAAKNKHVQALFGVLGFKYVHENDEVLIELNADPGKAALALPVAMELLASLTTTNSAKDLSSRWNILKASLEGSRLTSGFTLASGEEPPLGIATAAFDGLQSTKWEEPNGANGAWITYELPNTNSKVLIQYELTSANDCSERDPMDWFLEGSNDEGGNWTCLDSQKGQLFDNRFERKLFKVPSNKHLFCHRYRFRFTSVRDPSKTSRLQVACIDLYARKEILGQN